MMKNRKICHKILLFIFLIIITFCTKTYAADNSKKVIRIDCKHVGEGLSLIWQSVKDATGYEIYISNDNSNFKKLTDKLITDNRAIITNIDHSAKYYIKILAYTDVRTTNNSTGEKEITKEYYGFKPENVNAITVEPSPQTPQSSNKITGLTWTIGNINKRVQVEGSSDEVWKPVTFKWNAIDGATGYSVFITEPFGNNTFYMDYNTTSTTFSLDLPNHEEGLYYKVKIGAYVNEPNVDANYFAYSNEKTFQILDDHSDETASTLSSVNLAASNVLDNSTTFRWNNVVNADGYELQLSLLGVSDRIIDLKPIDLSATSFSLTDVKYDCMAKVRAYKNVANSDEKIYSDYSDGKIASVKSNNNYGWNKTANLVGTFFASLQDYAKHTFLKI